MVREETLRALISARETISESMRNAAEGTRDLGQAMAEAVVSSGAVANSLNLAETETNQYQRAVAGLGREMMTTATQQKFYSETIEDAGGDALVAAAKMQAYRSSVDEAGDQATQAAVQNFGLATSLSGVAAAAGAASVNIGPFNTNVKAAIIALPALVALVGAVTVGLAGLATAAIGAAGALALLFTGGLLGRAEEMERHSAGIESRMQALEEIFSSMAGALSQALEPVQNLSAQDAAFSVLQGIVTIIGDLANSAARLQGLFGRVAERLDSVFWAEEARGIAEMEQIIQELMPHLERLTFYILTNLPDFIAWMRQEANQIIPVLGNFTNSAINLGRELVEIGTTLLSLTLPALSILLDAGALILDVFTKIPDALYAAAIAFGVVAGALFLYSGSATIAAIATALLDLALSPIIATVTAVASAVSATTLAIAGLAAVLVGAITYFNLWDDIIGGLVVLWNMLVESIEFVVNAFIWLSHVLSDTLGPLLMLMGGVGILMLLIGNWDKVMQALGRTIEWLGNMWEGFVETVMRWIGPILEAIGLVHDTVDEAGGIELNAAKLDRPGGDPSGEGPSQEQARRRADQGAGAGVRRRSQQVREQRQQNNFDFSGASFGEDTSEAQVERAVERALERNQSQSSDT